MWHAVATLVFFLFFGDVCGVVLRLLRFLCFALLCLTLFAWSCLSPVCQNFALSCLALPRLLLSFIAVFYLAKPHAAHPNLKEWDWGNHPD
jgi:hypothetical protein